MGRKIALLVILCCLLAAPALAENRVLLVGCDRFLTRQDTFPASEGNTRSMAEVLTGGLMAPARVLRCQDSLADSTALAGAVAEAFAGAQPGDVSYLYLSTHGLWLPEQSAEETALLLTDGEREGQVSARELREMLDAVPGTKVLLVDACHSGAMIGKGVREELGNVFAGGDYQIVTSCGGAEESWFWAAEGDRARLGAGSFSSALSRALSAAGNYAADDNRDGRITLTELRRYLRDNHGESTVHTYPEESDFTLIRYDAANTVKTRTAMVEALSFEDRVLSPLQSEVHFSFNVLRTGRLLYRLVEQVEGRWHFDGASLTDDSALTGDGSRALSPGLKERVISLDEGSPAGYLLLQLVTVVNGETALASSQVLCLPPGAGDPALAIHTPQLLAAGAEMNIVVDHAFPCELAVQIVDADGENVRRLQAREGTRPQHLIPAGSTLCWDGLRTDGSPAAPGRYRVLVTAWVGEDEYRAESDWFELAGG